MTLLYLLSPQFSSCDATQIILYTMSFGLQFAFGFSWHVLQSSCFQLFSFCGLHLTRARFRDCPALSTTRIFNSASLSAFWHCFANSLFGVESTRRTVSYPPFAYHQTLPLINTLSILYQYSINTLPLINTLSILFIYTLPLICILTKAGMKYLRLIFKRKPTNPISPKMNIMH